MMTNDSSSMITGRFVFQKKKYIYIIYCFIIHKKYIINKDIYKYISLNKNVFISMVKNYFETNMNIMKKL